MNTRCGWGGVARTSRDPVWCNKSTVISLANRRGRVGCWTLERQCGPVPIHATTPIGAALAHYDRPLPSIAAYDTLLSQAGTR